MPRNLLTLEWLSQDRHLACPACHGAAANYHYADWESILTMVIRQGRADIVVRRPDSNDWVQAIELRCTTCGFTESMSRFLDPAHQRPPGQTAVQQARQVMYASEVAEVNPYVDTAATVDFPPVQEYSPPQPTMEDWTVPGNPVNDSRDVHTEAPPPIPTPTLTAPPALWDMPLGELRRAHWNTWILDDFDTNTTNGGEQDGLPSQNV